MLAVDRHESHKSIKFEVFSKENKITFFCLLMHLTYFNYWGLGVLGLLRRHTVKSRTS